MNFKDCTDRTIQIGDVILYTQSSDGHAAAMKAGRVTRFTAKCVVVQPVEPVEPFDPKQQELYFMQETGRMLTANPGTRWERRYPETERVVTGREPVAEQLIPNPHSYRFYILKQV